MSGACVLLSAMRFEASGSILNFVLALIAPLVGGDRADVWVALGVFIAGNFHVGAWPRWGRFPRRRRDGDVEARPLMEAAIGLVLW